nr:unnamed protein product [Digitaria exilis]
MRKARPPGHVSRGKGPRPPRKDFIVEERQLENGSEAKRNPQSGAGAVAVAVAATEESSGGRNRGRDGRARDHAALVARHPTWLAGLSAAGPAAPG